MKRCKQRSVVLLYLGIVKSNDVAISATPGNINARKICPEMDISVVELHDADNASVRTPSRCLKPTQRRKAQGQRENDAERYTTKERIHELFLVV